MFLLFIAAASVATAPAPSEPVPVATPFGTAARLDEGKLATATAREDINQIANSEQAASVSSSSVSGNTQTGNATFSDSAFSNVSGLTVINSNTGNNVAINGAITVNLTITPPTPR